MIDRKEKVRQENEGERSLRSLLTKPFEFTGSRLVLNVNVKSGGLVKAVLLDKHGKPIEGFDAGKCDAITGDHIAKVVTWNGMSDLSSLSGRLIRLKLKLADASLYSFRFCRRSN